MRTITIICCCLITPCVSWAADVESRVLTHYVPQDFLETAIRTENWSELPLAVKGGLRKGDTVRIWAGGVIDRGNGDQPGFNCNGPEGIGPSGAGDQKPAFALSTAPADAYALMFKTDGTSPVRCVAAGKPLEIKVAKDQAKVWIGFNDEKGRYQDNHLGKGKRHELDPLWVRIEVVRIIVD